MRKSIKLGRDVLVTIEIIDIQKIVGLAAACLNALCQLIEKRGIRYYGTVFLIDDKGQGAFLCPGSRGFPTRNGYLMQLQSDLSKVQVRVPKAEELSGIGAAYLAGIALGIYQEDTLFLGMEYQTFVPKMEEAEREKKLSAWKEAVNSVIKCR